MTKDIDTSKLISDVIQASREEGILGDKSGEERKGDETPSGSEKLPEFMQDIDISGLSEESIQGLVKKGEQLYSDYQKKTTKLSEREKKVAEIEQIVDELNKDPALKDKISKTYFSHKSGANAGQDRNEVREIFDQWIEQTYDPQAKESIRQLAQAVEQKVAKVGVTKKEIEDIRSRLNFLISDSHAARQERLVSEVDNLPKAFKPLAEKFEDELNALGLQFPNAQIRDLLRVVAKEEYDEAVYADRQEKLKKDIEKKKEVGSFEQTGALSVKGLEKDLLIKPNSNRFGAKWNTGKLIDKFFPEVKNGMPT